MNTPTKLTPEIKTAIENIFEADMQAIYNNDKDAIKKAEAKARELGLMDEEGLFNSNLPEEIKKFIDTKI